jgi:hypothetical protein
VSVSPAVVTFGSCTAGTSTATELGFPSGRCTVGGFPYTAPSVGGVTVTNAGAAGEIEVNGTNAIPSDDVAPWTLVSGTPGANQFFLETIGWDGTTGTVGYIGAPPVCDNAFDFYSCSVPSGQSQAEELEIVGPSSSTDTSTSFTTIVTWTAAPASGQVKHPNH